MDQWLEKRRVVERRHYHDHDHDRRKPGEQGKREKLVGRAAGGMDQEVKSEEVRRHESIREYTRV